VLYNVEKRVQYWTWLIACAITLGGPGVWALHVIGLTALSLPAVTITFNPSLAIGALVVALVCSLLSLYLAFGGWKYNSDRDPQNTASVAPAPSVIASGTVTLPPPSALASSGSGSVPPSAAASPLPPSNPSIAGIQLALARRSPTNPIPTFVSSPLTSGAISPLPDQRSSAVAAAAAAAVAAATGGGPPNALGSGNHSGSGNSTGSVGNFVTTAASLRSGTLAVPGAEVGNGESPPQRVRVTGRTVESAATPGAPLVLPTSLATISVGFFFFLCFDVSLMHMLSCDV
jgi:hypothetical protein